MILYRGTCEEYLGHEATDFKGVKKTDLLSEIRSMESDMCTRLWLQAADSHATQILQEDLIKLRRMEYYARYGDYSQRLAHHLRDETNLRKSEGWELLSGANRWSEISNAIHGEAEWWQEWGSSRGTENVKTIYAVYLGCKDIQAIHMYGTRNETFHSSIPDLVKRAQFARVAEILYLDLKDLSSIMPLNMQREEEFMRAVVLELIDNWFKKDYDPDTPGSWTPTENLIEHWKELTGKRKKSEKGRFEHEIAVESAALKRLEKLQEDDLLIEQLRGPFSETSALPPPGPLPKRKPTEDPPDS